LYVAAALLTLGVGVLDEVYQGWLPNRCFDVNDIITNGSSGVLGLIYVWGVMRPGPLRQRFYSILKGGHKGAESFA
jgi:VanZ family protein